AVMRSRNGKLLAVVHHVNLKIGRLRIATQTSQHWSSVGSRSDRCCSIILGSVICGSGKHSAPSEPTRLICNAAAQEGRVLRGVASEPDLPGGLVSRSR